MARVNEPGAGDKKSLLASTNHLKPVVIIGHKGVTESVIAAIDEALKAHELVKIKFNDFKDKKTHLAETIAISTSSILLGIIGNVAAFYRPGNN